MGYPGQERLEFLEEAHGLGEREVGDLALGEVVVVTSELNLH